LIRKCKGRIINITSIAGRIYNLGISSYCSSKFAFEGFSDCLRLELSKVGVKVIIIEPSFMNTPIVLSATTRLQETLSKTNPELLKVYDIDPELIVGKMKKRIEMIMHDSSVAVNSIFDSIVSKYPQTRYMPGLDSAFFLRFLSYLPAGLTDPFLQYLKDRE